VYWTYIHSLFFVLFCRLWRSSLLLYRSRSLYAKTGTKTVHFLANSNLSTIPHQKGRTFTMTVTNGHMYPIWIQCPFNAHCVHIEYMCPLWELMEILTFSHRWKRAHGEKQGPCWTMTFDDYYEWTHVFYMATMPIQCAFYPYRIHVSIMRIDGDLDLFTQVKTRAWWKIEPMLDHGFRWLLRMDTCILYGYNAHSMRILSI
jgi:hypothetical protein